MPEQQSLAGRPIAAMLLIGALAGIALVGGSMPALARTQTAPETPSATLSATLSPAPGASPLAPAEAPARTATVAPPDSTAIAPAQLIATSTPTRTPTPINIGNFVWDDLDQDGRQDAGEPGLSGVTVQLWNSGKTQLIDQTTTSASGSYTVVAPLPGDYRIRVVLPNALDAFSPKDQAGGDDLLDSDINPSGVNLGFSDAFTLASNVISTTIHDAGIIVFRPPTPTRTPTPINIGNFVWVDLNADGIQDVGEPGLGGVTVQLWNSDRTELIDQTTTGASGSYTVVAPLPGDYCVRVILPSGASFSPKDAGADDQKDSDINRLIFVNTFGFTDIFTIASNVISTTIYDAGLINVPPTATPSRTPTGTPPTATPSRTPTATMPAALDERLHLPMLRR